MSTSRSGARHFGYGNTHVVMPKGRHLATIVWLHGVGDDGLSESQRLERLAMPNVKFICPTAPTRRRVAYFGEFTCNAWFNLVALSADSPVDIEGLDASAAYAASLLSNEPANVKLGIGGFCMGGAVALYSATCFAVGRFANGSQYPINLRAVVGLSCWLPGLRSMKNRIEASHNAARRAASLPIWLCHGNSDEIIAYNHGEESRAALASAGFQNLTFECLDGIGHFTTPVEMYSVYNFLACWLGLGN